MEGSYNSCVNIFVSNLHVVLRLELHLSRLHLARFDYTHSLLGYLMLLIGIGERTHISKKAGRREERMTRRVGSSHFILGEFSPKSYLEKSYAKCTKEKDVFFWLYLPHSLQMFVPYSHVMELGIPDVATSSSIGQIQFSISP